MSKIRVQCVECGDTLPVTDCCIDNDIPQASGDMVLEVEPCKNCVEYIKEEAIKSYLE
jgi:formate dehydrogenase maturation protein FdhE